MNTYVLTAKSKGCCRAVGIVCRTADAVAEPTHQCLLLHQQYCRGCASAAGTGKDHSTTNEQNVFVRPFFYFYRKNACALQRVKFILILLLLYGLVKMKFTVEDRMYIYIFLENHELQLGVRSSQVSIRVFLNKFLI